MNKLISIFIIIMMLLPLIPSISADIAKVQLTTGATDSKIDKDTGVLTVAKWSGLSTIDFKSSDIFTTGSIADGKIKFIENGYVTSIYNVPDGIEYETVFSSKPIKYVQIYYIVLNGCKAYYQGPLDKGEQDPRWTGFVNATHAFDKNGNLIAYREPKVVGSYAIYTTSTDNWFQTGKVAHLYRPFVTDATGKTAWCDMVLDDKTGRLSVTMPKSFMDSAVYPVVLDPTFGYTSNGGSYTDFGGVYYGRASVFWFRNLGVRVHKMHLVHHAPLPGRNLQQCCQSIK
jgi:hypothetical protein